MTPPEVNNLPLLHMPGIKFPVTVVAVFSEIIIVVTSLFLAGDPDRAISNTVDCVSYCTDDVVDAVVAMEDKQTASVMERTNN